MPNSPYPKFRCPRCEDWTTLLAPDGRGTLPCPEPIHHTATTNPITGPKAGEESDERDRNDEIED
jgi:hypothetical protein